MSTVTITLSAKARETAYNVSYALKYSPDKVVIASELINKLRQGATPYEKTFKDPNGINEPITATVYKDFKVDPIEIGIEQKDLLIWALRQIKQWHPEEAKILQELQEQLQTKLV